MLPTKTGSEKHHHDRKASAERGGEAVSVDPVDRTLADFDGDARAAISALLGELDRLGYELAITRPVVSRGFSRGWHHKHGANDGHA